MTEDNPPGDDIVAESDFQAVPFRDLLRYLLGLGTWGFGGPIASVGYMQRDLVEKRKWLSRRDFLDGVALGQTMPGPLAAQVVMWLGYLRAGAKGALAAAIAFIAPSFALVLTVAIVYSHYSGSKIVQALFAGIAPVVMAIIAIAAYKIARTTNGKDWRLWTITAVIAVVTAATGTEVALLFIAAGLLMVVLDAPPKLRRRQPTASAFVPLGLPHLASTAAAGGVLVPLGWFFLKAGGFIFGSGLAIVPFLRSGVVEQHHWLTATQFLDAVAMGLITPGPVVITATFIGYLVGGLPGAIGAVVVLTHQTVTDIAGGVIAAVTLGILLRWKIKEPYLVAAGAIAGLALHWPF